MKNQRYVGTVSSTPRNEQYGFVNRSSVTNEDGSAANLRTSHDIYVHHDDGVSSLSVGMQIEFDAVADNRRGGDALRAINVTHHVSQELVLVGDNENGTGHALADPRSLYVRPTPAQLALMKPIDQGSVDKVIANRPMPLMPRTSGESTLSAAEITQRLMRKIFPQFEAINENGVDMASDAFDNVIKQAIADHQTFGMADQAAHMEKQARTYKGLRTVLRTEEDLLRPDTLIPIQYLPDLFMAVPVWYFYADAKTQKEASELKRLDDPHVHENLAYFCNLVPNQRWIDTFLMYNRRMRTLADYTGDIIPPRIIARMRKMALLFDFMVIMTPYHDVAGRDWEDLQWLRSIDPYLIGFVKGVPLMFVLGRFSDSGTFPLFNELVADTVGFLRGNIQRLQGFDRVNGPYWYQPGREKSVGSLGTKLIRHTENLLSAFDSGNLFDWLRGSDERLPASRN